MISGVVNNDITNPPQGISNISEWCKREGCWTRIQAKADVIAASLDSGFFDRLVSLDDQVEAERSARKTQKIDDGIEVQKKVLAVSSADWTRLNRTLLEKGVLSQKEMDVLKIAMQIPLKIPTEKQCAVLLEVIEKGRLEGVTLNKEA